MLFSKKQSIFIIILSLYLYLLKMLEFYKKLFISKDIILHSQEMLI